MEASSGGNHIPKIMTFRPTWEEFKDFNKYIEYIESQGAHKAGVCKIIPPKEWVPRKAGYDDVNLIIPAPIQQVVHGKQGLYTQLNVQKKPISVKDFEKMANRNSYRTPKHTDYDDLERRYWKNITFVNPIYGADVSGSITDPEQESWNIQKLGSILDCLGDDYGISIEGVNTAYLYFGMWKTTFAWHTEDMDLYSINYVHYGAPKRWYAVPPEHGRRFERLAKGFFSENSESCPAFLRHKMSLISPTMLKRYSIPCDTIVQEAGEIMITFPYGYHSGFNHGFNCAESTNFASRRWIEYGKRCTMCHCRKDSVKIDMGPFVKRFQPDLYDLWVSGKDNGPHPEDDRSRVHHHNDMVSLASPSKKLKRRSSDDVNVGEGLADSPSYTHDPLPVKKQKHNNSNSGGRVTKADTQSDSGRCDVGSELRAPAHSKLYQSEMDAPTDVSDALTDVEPEVAVPHSSTHDVGQGQTEAHTFTRPCKPKHNKCTRDDPDLIVVKYPWAKSLTRLWKFNPPDFEAEKRYNRRMSQRKPFCAICSIICRRDDESAPVKAPRTKTPDSTAPLLPPSSFMAPEEAVHMSPPKSPKQRPLLVCKDCNVCVHDTCYGGVKFLHNGPKSWQCTRCMQEAISAECILCCLRGGALKPTTDSKWVHVVCAIANTEVTFNSASSREPVSISNVDRARGSLKCSYCGTLTHINGKDKYGKCVQCTTGQCSKSFHLTCARAAGLRVDLGTGALRLHITCNRHTDGSRKEEQVARSDLHLNDEVYARYKNGRYYKGEITNINNQLYYCVLFEDNSLSRDLFPEDILNYPVSAGPPPMAHPVTVKWTDGQIYNGLFQGTRSIDLYTVSFEDGSQLQLEKDQVYSIHEQLPTSVQKKLSRATEMRNDVFYRKDSDLLTETRTRGVQVNYNYKWEFMLK